MIAQLTGRLYLVPTDAHYWTTHHSENDLTKISLKLARRISLNAQLLDGKTQLPKGKEGIARTIETLGYVQVDTIAVIERAHHHALWTRRPDYDPEMLHELQAKDRRVFEYWGHALSYLPMTDYRYYLPRMRKFNDPHGKWERERLKKYGHLMRPVLERVRKEGPLGSKDFAQPPSKKTILPWDRNPMKAALEMLFWRGDLMITERRKFQRIFDLTERVLPESANSSFPDDDELGQFLVRRALSAYGLATEYEIRKHIDAADKEVIAEALADLIDAGEVRYLTVKGIEEMDYFVLSDRLETSTKLRKASPRLHLLSPFDNLIIQRERVKRLFGFDYALECYVPPAKRKYGYFVLPILWDEKIVGRLDPKADRKKETLVINSLLLEDTFNKRGAFLEALSRKLWDLARFNKCEKITIKRTSPAHIRTELEGSLKGILLFGKARK
jgi:uncharacterized protein YcaQ